LLSEQGFLDSAVRLLLRYYFENGEIFAKELWSMFLFSYNDQVESFTELKPFNLFYLVAWLATTVCPAL
jgi:hypothetical protein